MKTFVERGLPLCAINRMAKEYYEKLSNFLIDVGIKKEITKPMEVKHFFSGAALYVNQTICVSLSPLTFPSASTLTSAGTPA